MVHVEALRDRIPLWKGAGKAPRWDLMGTEAYDGGKVFWWTFWWFGNIWEFIEQVLGLGDSRGAHKPLGCPPRAHPLPRGPLEAPPTYFFLLYISMYPPKDRGRSQKPNSTAATFCIHEIPSWGLFQSSAGGGIDHGGLLHHHPSPSEEV